MGRSADDGRRRGRGHGAVSGAELARRGREFGATTGRPRRCGWLDLPLLRYAVAVSGITSLALTKTDVLAGLSPLRVCRAYRHGDREVERPWPSLDLAQVEPVYEDMEPLGCDPWAGGRPSPALARYIEAVEKAAGVPVGIVSKGPGRDDVVLRRAYFD